MTTSDSCGLQKLPGAALSATRQGGSGHVSMRMAMSSQVQLMKQFDLQLVWYGAGNAIFAHRLAAHLLGLLGSAITVRRPTCSAISLPVRGCLSAGLPSPLDEVDCYAKSVLMTMWPSGRTLRRWFYEETCSCSVPDVCDLPDCQQDNLNDTFIEVRAALTKRLGNLPFTLEM